MKNHNHIDRFLIVGLATVVVLMPLFAHSDIVHSDDVIITGGLAVGVDAVNGETFGTDTMRLKQNIVRVHFDDTSGTASFPRNDWRIVINDQFNGGSEHFSIEDSTAGRVPFRIEAGAPAHSLVVEGDGDVGLGTLNPAVDLHIVTGNSPELRLEQDNSSGLGQQSWDIAGNETSFFVRDVSNGNTLPFRIAPGSSTDVLTITGSRVGVNTFTPSPSHSFHVAGNALIDSDVEVGSSRKTKEDIRDLTLEEAQETLRSLVPVQFRYKTTSGLQLGFIAEDVPDLVATETRESVSPMDFVALLTKVVQEQQNQIEQLEQKLEEVNDGPDGL